MSLDEEAIKKAWVKRVKEMMPQKGFKTYQDLAYESGVSPGSLNQAMRGMHLPRQTTIDKIATALGTTSQFLLYGDSMKVMKSLPILFNEKLIWEWVYGDRNALESLAYHDIDSGLDVSPDAFVWLVNKNDMVPEFYPGDLLIIDTRDVHDKSIWVQRNPVYVIGVELSQASPIQTIFGQAFMTSCGFYLISCNEKIPSIKLQPDQYKMVGRVVQLLRTFI